VAGGVVLVLTKDYSAGAIAAIAGYLFGSPTGC
jgi:hypothetical protein